MEREIPGASVRGVASALEYGEALSDGGFDLIVTDCRFTWAPGAALLKSLKKRFPEAPVILFSDPLDERLENTVFAVGVHDCLVKSPSGFLALPRAVRQAFRRSQALSGERSAERELRDLLERSMVGTFKADWTGKLQKVNRAAAQLLGSVSPKAVEGTEMRGLFYQSGSPAELIERVKKHGFTHRRQIEVPRIAGSPVWLSVIETVSIDDNGVPSIAGMLEEVSQPLSRAGQDLQNFAHVASHELQEPLRMIERYTRILEDEYGSKLDSDGAECVRFAHDGARRMQTLIDDLLAFSRVESGGGAFQDCDSGALAEQAIDNLRALVEERQAVVLPDALPRVTADPGQIVLLFQNLIGNAVKFQKSGQRPLVRISARKTEENVLFAVKDNGIGMKPEETEKIFEPFKRLHPNYSGSGLGLAICRRIVKRHGGKIWVESQLGRGSTFFVQLPCHAPGVA